MAVHLLGIRHHGPGSARSVLEALVRIAPDIVLIEGPPDAHDVLPLALHEAMEPPVALLIHAQDDPARAAYYPFASFSPEWVAIRHALERGIAVRFMDAPVAQMLALEDATAKATRRKREESLPGVGVTLPLFPDEPARPKRRDPRTDALRQDPLLAMAQAAGYADSERWWGHLVEERRDHTAVFDAILEAMTALREELEPTASEFDPGDSYLERIREAHMRMALRGAHKDGYERIAVICGAWHVPALSRLPTEKADRALLAGLPKCKVHATWIPWSHGRLSLDSGYGAGVAAPGWYHHLFTVNDDVEVRWLTRVARLLRGEGLDVTSAHVIDAVRLAGSLAALRDRPAAGLIELTEATEAVFLAGEALPLALIETRLVVGERLGAVPAETPMVPLQRDVAHWQRRLRLRPDAGDRSIVLDLRKDNDRERSRLLRRLQLLDIPWGTGGERGEGQGTFKEEWELAWDPEYELLIIEASMYGGTVEQAASAITTRRARELHALPALTELIHDVVLADLPDALAPLLQRLQDESAVAADLTHLMGAIPPLAQLVRYGDVRNTETSVVERVVRGLSARVCAGLPVACASLREEAADGMLRHLIATHHCLVLLADSTILEIWLETLGRLSAQTAAPGQLRGRACRLLLDGEVMTQEEGARAMALALSPAEEPARAAGWVEGFLRGSGQILVYDDALWRLVDAWLTALSEDSFTQLLPLLRRTFGTFTAPERRRIGERAAQSSTAVRPPAEQPAVQAFDERGAAAALPLARTLLGLEGAG